MIEIPKNIIWIHTAFLGDLILLTAASKLLRKHYPQVKQSLITTHVGSSLFKDGDEFDSVFVFEKNRELGLNKFFDVVNRVKKELTSKDCLTIQAHKSFRSTILNKLLGYPSITYHETNWSGLSTYRVFRLATFHEVTRLGNLLEPLGIGREKTVNLRPYLSVQKETKNTELRTAFEGLKAGALKVAIAPGSRWGTKKWPIQSYRQLVKYLLDKNAAVILIGSKGELEDCQELEIGDSQSVINLCGKTSLPDLRYVFPKLDLVITNDSSPIHFASAFNIPTIAIFGATIPEFGFGPLAEDSEVVELQGLDCRPCSDHGPDSCPLGHFKCMKDLPVNAVEQAVHKVLKARKTLDKLETR